MSAFAFAHRMEGVTGNIIREILKLTRQPNVISFAGGLPSPESFPVDALREITSELMAGDLGGVLQYSTSEGFDPLRAQIAAWVGDRGINAKVDEVLILSGSQQGIDLACKAFINAGDTILVERPTYLAALQIFKMYGATVQAVATDEDGMDIEALERAVSMYKPKMIYLVPTFRNPSGETWALERRRAAVELASRHGIVVLEDDPYGMLRYSGSEVPALRSFDTTGHVIYLGSFSKIISPGLRIGYAVGNSEVLRRLVTGKQTTDVHTNNLSQAIVSAFFDAELLEPHLAKVCALYKEKRDAMLQAMSTHFPKGIRWTKPDGGLFIWATLPEGASTPAIMKVAVDRQVVFIPGVPFYHDGSGENTMRLNFSNASLENIAIGIERLGGVLKSTLNV